MRRVLAAAACGLVGLALAGCGASQTASTSQDRPSVPGVNVTEAGMAIRNAVVPFSPDGYPAGGDAPVRLSLFNETDQQVRLVQATSPTGQAVTVSEAVAVGPPAPPAEGVPGGEQPEQEQPDVPPPDGATGTELVLAPGEFVNATLQITGLTQDLDMTSIVPLELVLDNGAAITLSVPVAPPMDPVPRGEPRDVGHH